MESCIIQSLLVKDGAARGRPGANGMDVCGGQMETMRSHPSLFCNLFCCFTLKFGRTERATFTFACFSSGALGVGTVERKYTPTWMEIFSR
jgi:hypothetical protein